MMFQCTKFLLSFFFFFVVVVVVFFFSFNEPHKMSANFLRRRRRLVLPFPAPNRPTDRPTDPRLKEEGKLRQIVGHRKREKEEEENGRTVIGFLSSSRNSFFLISFGRELKAKRRALAAASSSLVPGVLPFLYLQYHKDNNNPTRTTPIFFFLAYPSAMKEGVKKGLLQALPPSLHLIPFGLRKPKRATTRVEILFFPTQSVIRLCHTRTSL